MEDQEPNEWEDEPMRPLLDDAIPPLRVLVAEDDAPMRCLIVEHLLSSGCEVYEASNGDEALGMMARIAVHGSRAGDLQLAILDVRMPGLSGLEIAYELRVRHWNTPLLLMTAFPEPELIEEAERLGVAVLAKPFEPHLLGRAISALRLDSR